MSAAAGFLASAQGVLAKGLALLQARLELLSVEIEEERNRIGMLVVLGALAFFFIGFGALALAIFFTVVLWDTQRLLPLAVLTALFLGAGLVCVLLALRVWLRRSRLFAASIAELSLDRQALTRE